MATPQQKPSGPSAQAKRLEQENLLLSTIVNQNAGSIYIVQHDRVVFHNPPFAAITGYSPRRLQALNFHDIVHPKDKRLIALLFRDGFSEIVRNSSQTFTFRFIHRDGSTRWLKTNVSVVRWADGPALLNNAFDITPQKEFEEKLIAEEQNFRLLVNAFEDFVFIINRRGTIVQANQAVFDGLQYPAHQVLLGSFVGLFPARERAEVRGKLTRAGLGGRELYAGHIKSSAGRPIPVEVRLFSGRWSGREVVFAICQDVTQRQLAQEKLRLSEQRFRQLAELFPEMILEANPKGVITFANDILLRTFRAQPSKIQEGWRLGALFAPRDAAAVRQFVRNAALQPDFPSIELSARRADGSTFPALTHIIAVLEGHAVKRFMGILVNITARKQQETELLRAKEEAEEASRAKEQFLSTMSHEIRTPMNAVIGMANLLIQENPLEHQMENMRALKLSAENLMALLNDILDFSKIEAGKLHIDPLPINLHEIVHGLAAAFRVTAQQKGLYLNLFFDDRLPRVVKGDSVRIIQVINNLLANAIKFTHSGGVTLGVRLVRELRRTADIRFSVSDTGVGIPADKQKLIFKEFTQATQATTRLYGGSGLGLAISQRLVALMGGDIALRTKLGRGSEFSFTLSLAKARAVKPKASTGPAQPLPTARSHRILVVEDNEINSTIVLQFLGKWGFKADLAENGAIALDMVRREAYDLILMDLEMPVMSGYEATEAIRAMPDARVNAIPIIALTASAMLNVQKKIFRMGMNGFVLKPFNPNELRDKILALLGQPA